LFLGHGFLALLLQLLLLQLIHFLFLHLRGLRHASPVGL